MSKLGQTIVNQANLSTNQDYTSSNLGKQSNNGINFGQNHQYKFRAKS